MSITLSAKERTLLEDLKKQEDICVKKYASFSQSATDMELKNLFTKLSGEEQQHYTTINQMLQGQEPNMNQNSQNQQQQPQQNQNSGFTNTMNHQSDCDLCNDLLSTEKYVSSTYDTAVFESANPRVRQAVQHIQQDEQRHGEELFNYMNAHGMYDVK